MQHFLEVTGDCTRSSAFALLGVPQAKSVYHPRFIRRYWDYSIFDRPYPGLDSGNKHVRTHRYHTAYSTTVTMELQLKSTYDFTSHNTPLTSTPITYTLDKKLDRNKTLLFIPGTRNYILGAYNLLYIHLVPGKMISRLPI